MRGREFQIVSGGVTLLIGLFFILGWMVSGAYMCNEMGGYYNKDLHCYLNYSIDSYGRAYIGEEEWDLTGNLSYYSWESPQQ